MDMWTLVWLLLFLFVIICAFVIGFIIYQIKVYKFKIRLYENIGGKWQETRLLKARKILVKDSLGESVLFVPKVKSFVSSYGEQMGKRMYYYAVGEDGYWYNITLGDIDAKMGILDIEVVNRDVRGFHSTNQKRIKNRYEKPKNWPMVVAALSIILALVIVFGGGYFLYGQIGEITEASKGSLGAAKEISTANLATIEAMEKLTGRLEVLLNNQNITVKDGETGIR
jgi:hypothetical protein